jgi:hypothetical protein
MKTFGNSGFSAVEVLTSTIIIGMSGLAIAGFGEAMNKYSQNIKTKSGVADVRAEIIASTMDAKSWALNINNAGAEIPVGSSHIVNTAMLCLKNNTACDEGVYNMTLLGPDGSILVDADNPNQGFTANGVRCTTYGITDDSQCVFRYELQWEPICPPAQTACVNPQIRLTANLQVNVMYAKLMNIQTTSMQVFAPKPDFSTGPAPLPPVPPPVIPGGPVFYTNSTLYSVNNTVTVDLSTVVPNPVGATYSLPSATSAVGGAMTLVGSMLTYTPAPGFYGHDSFNFVVTDAASVSTLTPTKMEVMTPHTWTGQGVANDTNDPGNWCGEVVAGACDHSTFGATGFLGAQSHLVMDQTCQTNCSPTFSQPNLIIGKLETKPGYTGTLTVSSTNVRINNNSAVGTAYNSASQTLATNDFVPELNLNGGTFKCTSPGALVVYGSANVAASVRSVEFCPSTFIYSNKNNPLFGAGGVPAAGSYTGLTIQASAAQLPTWTTAGNSITFEPVGGGKPEINIQDATLSLTQLNITNCENSATCQVYFPSPPPALGNNISNSNMTAGTPADNCKSFFAASSTIVGDAAYAANTANDQDHTGFAGNLIIDHARNVALNSGAAGLIAVKSALRVTSLSNLAVNTLLINALQVDKIEGTAAGTICVKTSNLGLIDGSATSSMFISADRINLIQGVAAGNLYVLGATIDKLEGTAGTVCLYNGATVLDQSGFAGTISSTCPIVF